MNAHLTQKLQKVEWAEFEVGEIFEKIKTNNVIQNDIGDLPATTATWSNNQIGKYISRKNATILKNVFSATANGFGKVFYQPREFTVLQDSYAFWFKDKNIPTEKIQTFVVAIMNNLFAKYDWGNKSGWNKIKTEKIPLPVKNGEIDFDFMESFVSELEAERIEQLEAYLLATGLKDYHLTSEEIAILDRFQRGEVEWKEFELQELFESMNWNVDIQKEHINDLGEWVITSWLTNNGILWKTDITARIFNKNTITIDMFGNTFYRQFCYKMVTHARVFSLAPQFVMDKNIGLFITSLFMSFKTKFHYSNMCSWNKVKTEKIPLPIKNGEIDFDFMESFARIMEKQTIAGVVEYSDEKIRLTKQIVAQ